jgi:hypothetical protein
VESNHSRLVIGALLGLAVAAGFEFELAWLFLAGLALFLAFLGYLLLGPDPR